MSTTPPAGTAPEQAVHDVGTGQVVVDRAAGTVQVAYTGNGPFRITRELRDVFRAIFDRADEAEKAIADSAVVGVDAAETAAAAATGNIPAAAANADRTVQAGETAAHDWETTAHDVAAEGHALDVGEPVPAETGGVVNPAPVPPAGAAAAATVTVPAEELAAFEAWRAQQQSAPAPAPAAEASSSSAPLASLDGGHSVDASTAGAS